MLNPRSESSTPRAKAEIARENGAKSHGPVTAEGKARSSQNAATHSLSTANVVSLTNEDQQRYTAHCQSYANFWNPTNIMEVDLVEEMAASKWQERRCQAVETALLNLQIQIQTNDDVKKNLENLDETYRTALAFMQLADESRVLQLLLRYSNEHNRRYHRAMRQMITLRSKGFAESAEKRKEPTTTANTNKITGQQRAQTQPEAPSETQPMTQPPATCEKVIPSGPVPRVFHQAA